MFSSDSGVGALQNTIKSGYLSNKLAFHKYGSPIFESYPENG